MRSVGTSWSAHGDAGDAVPCRQSRCVGLRETSVRPCRRGFTFIELLIVVLVLGIMFAAAVPRFSDSVVRLRLDAAARRIAADLAAAQARARATSSRQTIVFTVPPAGSRYQIVGMPDPDRPGATYAVDLANAPYAAALKTVDLGGDTTLIYNGYGLPDSAGTIVVQAGRYTKTVAIDPDTGAAAVAAGTATVESPPSEQGSVAP